MLLIFQNLRKRRYQKTRSRPKSAFSPIYGTTERTQVKIGNWLLGGVLSSLLLTSLTFVIYNIFASGVNTEDFWSPLTVGAFLVFFSIPLVSSLKTKIESVVIPSTIQTEVSEVTHSVKKIQHWGSRSLLEEDVEVQRLVVEATSLYDDFLLGLNELFAAGPELFRAVTKKGWRSRRGDEALADQISDILRLSETFKDVERKLRVIAENAQRKAQENEERQKEEKFQDLLARDLSPEGQSIQTILRASEQSLKNSLEDVVLKQAAVNKGALEIQNHLKNLNGS